MLAGAFPYLALCGKDECVCDRGAPCPINEAAADELLTYLTEAGLVLAINPNKEK